MRKIVSAFLISAAFSAVMLFLPPLLPVIHAQPTVIIVGSDDEEESVQGTSEQMAPETGGEYQPEQPQYEDQQGDVGGRYEDDSVNVQVLGEQPSEQEYGRESDPESGQGEQMEEEDPDSPEIYEESEEQAEQEYEPAPEPGQVLPEEEQGEQDGRSEEQLIDPDMQKP